MYILDPEKQHRLVAGFTCIEDDIWQKRYIDETGHEWTLYYPYSAMHGGGPAYLRRDSIPEHATEVATWVTELLQTGRKDNATGAATDLRELHDYWPAVIALLEASREALPAEMVATFIDQLGITNAQNRRPILGKSVAEITEDAAYFSMLAKRASRLL